MSSAAFVAVADRITLTGESNSIRISNSLTCDFCASGPPKIGAERNRDIIFLRASIDLLAAGNRPLEVVYDRGGKLGLARSFHPLGKRDERGIEKRSGFRHHCHRLFAGKIGMFDRAHAGPQASPNAQCRHGPSHTCREMPPPRRQHLVSSASEYSYRVACASAGNTTTPEANIFICDAPRRSSSRAAFRTSSMPSAITDMTENGLT